MEGLRISIQRLSFVVSFRDVVIGLSRLHYWHNRRAAEGSSMSSTVPPSTASKLTVSETLGVATGRALTRLPSMGVGRTRLVNKGSDAAVLSSSVGVVLGVRIRRIKHVDVLTMWRLVSDWESSVSKDVCYSSARLVPPPAQIFP